MSQDKPGLHLLNLSFSKRGGVHLVRFSYRVSLFSILAGVIGGVATCFSAAEAAFRYMRVAQIESSLALVSRLQSASSYQNEGLLWVLGLLAAPAAGLIALVSSRLVHEVALALLTNQGPGERAAIIEKMRTRIHSRPTDAESLTPEELEAIDRGRRDPDVYSDDEVRADLGLPPRATPGS